MNEYTEYDLRHWEDDEFEAPNIQIQSYTVYENLSDMEEEDGEHEVRYGVSVSGTVN